MKPLVYCCFLDLPPGREASVEESLRRLQELMKRPPLEVDCPIGRLPGNIQEKVIHDLHNQDFNHAVANACLTLAEQTGALSAACAAPQPTPKLIVFCDSRHRLARKCLDASPNALWGVACGGLAVCYALGNDCAIWHEALHLLGAKDCYEEENPSRNPGPTCENPECIMQYAPTKGVVDSFLPLCSGNAGRIKSLFASIKD